MKTTPIWIASLALAALVGNAASAQAQAVIFEYSGTVMAKDHFGGSGTSSLSTPSFLGSSFSSTLTSSPTVSGASASVTASAAGGTLSMSMDSHSTSTYVPGMNFFIYSADAAGFAVPWVLGGVGTPFEMTLTASGFNQLVNPVGISSAMGRTDGWYVIWDNATGGTWHCSGTTNGTTITYNGQTYSRTLPFFSVNASTSTFLGHTGFEPSGPGVASLSAHNQVSLKVTNLGSYSVTPEAPGLLQLLPGLVPLGFALYKRRKGA